MKFDEYEIFAMLANKFRSCQNEQYLNWEQSLDENQKNFWNELIHTRRINLNVEDKASFSVPRRIVKIKRSNDNGQNTPSGQ